MHRRARIKDWSITSKKLNCLSRKRLAQKRFRSCVNLHKRPRNKNKFIKSYILRFAQTIKGMWIRDWRIEDLHNWFKVKDCSLYSCLGRCYWQETGWIYK